MKVSTSGGSRHRKNAPLLLELRTEVPAPGNIQYYATPLRFKLGGRRVLSARFNVETGREIEPRRVSKPLL